MQSSGVWSLNHHITTSLGLSPTPFFQKSIPNLHRHNGMGEPICPFTAYQEVLKHVVYPIWMWDAVHGGLEPQPSHYNITQAQPYSTFPRIHPQPVQV